MALRVVCAPPDCLCFASSRPESGSALSDRYKTGRLMSGSVCAASRMPRESARTGRCLQPLAPTFQARCSDPGCHAALNLHCKAGALCACSGGRVGGSQAACRGHCICYALYILDSRPELSTADCPCMCQRHCCLLHQQRADHALSHHAPASLGQPMVWCSPAVMGGLHVGQKGTCFQDSCLGAAEANMP